MTRYRLADWQAASRASTMAQLIAQLLSSLLHGRAAMRTRICFAVLVVTGLAIASTYSQEPVGEKPFPPPGSRGNADNVPFIGEGDPNRNPVRLAKATGHVSNYSEDKVAPYTLPDPLVMADGRRVNS